jgi:hypothetical protein
MGTFQGNIVIYILIGLALSIIHTWIYNSTNYSLLLVTLLHAAVDASTRTLLPLIFGSDRASGNLVPLISFGIWALILTIITRSNLNKNLHNKKEKIHRYMNQSQNSLFKAAIYSRPVAESRILGLVH